MKAPKLQKRYKVFWTYYTTSIGGIAHKTFEHCTKQIALDWVKQLLDWPLTRSIQITDYEGHYKVFNVETTEELLKRRDEVLDYWAEKYNGDKSMAAAELRKRGDKVISINKMNLSIMKYIEKKIKKQRQERQERLLER